MTAREWTENYINKCIRYVHADNHSRIHEKVKTLPDLWEVVKVREIRGKIYVEVREKQFGTNGTMYIDEFNLSKENEK